MRPVLLACCLAASAVVADSQFASARSRSGHWTIDDIVSIPEVIDVALSSDGRSAAYLLRAADIGMDRPDFELHVLEIGTRRDRIVARSAWIDRLRSVPARSSWSMLADLGKGVQLYEFENKGRPRPVIENPDTVLVGTADGAEFGYTGTVPVRFGVAYYDWSPDGRRLFYSTLHAKVPKRQVIFNEDVVAASARRRWSPQVSVKFFLREGSGKPYAVAEVADTDVVARALGGLPIWGPGYIEYGLQADERTDPAVARYRWSFDTHGTSRISGTPDQAARETAIGPRGGRLAIEWNGSQRHLLERIGSEVIDYGATDLSISDPRSPGAWRAPDGEFSMIAARNPIDGRYSLLRVDRAGRKMPIEAPGSLRHCAFISDATSGICVHEGLTQPPELVAVSSRTGNIERIRSIAAKYDQLQPFHVEKRTFVNSLGFKSLAFVIFPRGYKPGQKYPAIIINHGGDADERFGSFDLQWNYPVQSLAERGYFVILANEPYPSQSKMLEAANRTWITCNGEIAPSEVQRQIWLNAVESFRAAVTTLAAEGLIDADHVGIAGYSYGSQLTNVAITQTGLFKAASSGDGGYLEATAYRNHLCGYRAIYGGPPNDPLAHRNYVAFAPAYRAKNSRTPLLQQMAEPHDGAVELYQAMRAAGVPTTITLYPGEAPSADETHVFHIPSNQRAAMEENVEWFDFWLRGIRPSGSGSVARTEINRVAPQ